MANNPVAPEPPALDFEAWWIKHIRSDASGMVGRGLASIIWQAASAAQAKRHAATEKDACLQAERANEWQQRALAAEQRLADTQAWLEEAESLIVAAVDERYWEGAETYDRAVARHAARAKAKEPTDG